METLTYEMSKNNKNMLLKYLRLKFMSNANDIVTVHAHSYNQSKAIPSILYLMYNADWIDHRMKACEAYQVVAAKA